MSRRGLLSRVMRTEGVSLSPCLVQEVELKVVLVPVLHGLAERT